MNRHTEVSQLYQRHYRNLVRDIERKFSKLDRQSAEDVVAGVFEKIFAEYQQAGKTEKGKPELSYAQLLVRSRNRAIDEIRRRGRHAILISQGDEIPQADSQPFGRRSNSIPHVELIAGEKSNRRQFALRNAVRDFVRMCEEKKRYQKKLIFEARGLLGWPSRRVADFLQSEVSVINNSMRQTREWIERRLRRQYDVRGTLFESRYNILKDEPTSYSASVDKAAEKRRHLTKRQLNQYGRGELSQADRQAIGAHLEQCPECRRLVERVDDQESERAFLACLELERDDLGTLCPKETRVIQFAKGAIEDELQQKELALHISISACTSCLALYHRSGGDIHTLKNRLG